MQDDDLRRLIDLMLADHADGLDCEDCAAVVEAIARYVDLEIAGRQPGLAWPSIPIHLDLCAHCAEMYEALLYVARLEAEGALPDIAALQADIRIVLGPDSPSP